MNKIGIILIIMVTFVCLGEQKSGFSTQEEYLDYYDPNYEIKIQYSSSWILSDGNNNGSSKYNTGLNVVAEFMAPVQSKYFKPSDPNTYNSFGLIVENYSSPTISSVQEQLVDFGTKRIASVISVCPDLEIISMDRNATLSGTLANKIVYHYTHGGTTNKAIEIWTIKDDTSYLLAYGGHENYYDEYLPAVEKMFNSFEMTK